MTTTVGKLAIILAACLTIAAAGEIRAIAVLNGPVVLGNVTFTQDTYGGPVAITGVIMGLSPGPHGFHVHEKGDLSGGCASAAGHFNPDMLPHGAPESEKRHVGDLGNVNANTRGIAVLDFTDSIISLLPNSKNNIIGRAVVVHAGVDDFGLGGHPDSLTTGHAGGRLTCGVIGIQSPTTNLASKASITAPHYYFGLILITLTVFFNHFLK